MFSFTVCLACNRRFPFCFMFVHVFMCNRGLSSLVGLLLQFSFPRILPLSPLKIFPTAVLPPCLLIYIFSVSDSWHFLTERSLLHAEKKNLQLSFPVETFQKNDSDEMSKVLLSPPNKRKQNKELLREIQTSNDLSRALSRSQNVLLSNPITQSV